MSSTSPLRPWRFVHFSGTILIELIFVVGLVLSMPGVLLVGAPSRRARNVVPPQQGRHGGVPVGMLHGLQPSRCTILALLARKPTGYEIFFEILFFSGNG